MSELTWVLLAWVFATTLGVIINLWNMYLSAGDKQWMRNNHIHDPIRELLIDIHYSDAQARVVFKFVYGCVGLWTLLLRASNATPVTPTGWWFIGAMFFPIVWLTLTDVRNFKKRRRIVEAFMSGSVEKAIAADEPKDPAPEAGAAKKPNEGAVA